MRIKNACERCRCRTCLPRKHNRKANSPAQLWPACCVHLSACHSSLCRCHCAFLGTAHALCNPCCCSRPAPACHGTPDPCPGCRHVHGLCHCRAHNPCRCRAHAPCHCCCGTPCCRRAPCPCDPAHGHARPCCAPARARPCCGCAAGLEQVGRASAHPAVSAALRRSHGSSSSPGTACQSGGPAGTWGSSNDGVATICNSSNLLCMEHSSQDTAAAAWQVLTNRTSVVAMHPCPCPPCEACAPQAEQRVVASLNSHQGPKPLIKDPKAHLPPSSPTSQRYNAPHELSTRQASTKQRAVVRRMHASQQQMVSSCSTGDGALQCAPPQGRTAQQ